MMTWIALPALVFAVNMRIIGREFSDRAKAMASAAIIALAFLFALGVYHFSTWCATLTIAENSLFHGTLDVGISVMIITLWASCRVIVSALLGCETSRADRIIAIAAVYAAGIWWMLHFFLVCRP